MSTFTTLKNNVRLNLNDLGVISYSIDDLNAAFQDAYDDIATITQCIIKKITLNWVANLSYYNFISLGATDFLATVAIYNNVSKRWLDDYQTVRDFDSLNDKWELSIGTPTNWAPLNYQYTAIFPKYGNSPGDFDLYYWATAPVIVDAATPLIATDMQALLEKYSTADLLEQFEEYVSAMNFWQLYAQDIEVYRERVKNLAKSDLLLII
jgi:hypothetical protein